LADNWDFHLADAQVRQIIERTDMGRHHQGDDQTPDSAKRLEFVVVPHIIILCA